MPTSPAEPRRDDTQGWISDAEVAEIAFTAFTSKTKRKQVTARLIVRRVPDMNPAHQSELFTVYRYHAVFTNSPLSMLAAEKAHRAHAIVEQPGGRSTSGQERRHPARGSGCRRSGTSPSRSGPGPLPPRRGARRTGTFGLERLQRRRAGDA